MMPLSHFVACRSARVPRVGCAGLFVLLLSGLTPLAAQPGVSPAAASHVESVKVATDLITALNGDLAARKAWIDAYISSVGRQQKRAPLWLADSERISSAYGNLSLVSVTPAVGNAFVVQVKSALSRRSGNIRIVMSGSEARKVDAVFFRPAPATYDLSKSESALSQAEALRLIQERVALAVRDDDFSGVVLITKDGEPLYREVVGFSDREAALPNTADTRFNLASMDKMFTAIAIGQMIEAGKLSFDTRLIDVLPDYPNQNAAEKITIRHLLTHSAGLGSLFDRPGYDKSKPYDFVSGLFYAFASEPLFYEPGTRAIYSNEGFVVLGAFVEKLSGQSWFDYVQVNVLDKAGMKNTGHPLHDQAWPRKAIGYQFDRGDPLGLFARKPNHDIIGYRPNSAGGGYSTADDMTRFLVALKGGKLVSRDMVEQLTASVEGGWPNYAMGFQRSSIGNETLRGHDGGGSHSGINSFAKMLWDSGYTIAVMGNYDAPFAQQIGGDIVQILARVKPNA